MSIDFRTAPLDATSAERLAAQGLRLSLVDPADRHAFELWHQAVMRGLLAPRLNDDLMEERLEKLAYRRTTAVYDDANSDPADPVATLNSWVSELSVPGAHTVPAWAISSVTVAPTHRRRGISRSLLEAELRTAAALGVPLAMLTVTESSLYGRYGFAPAAMVADLKIDTRRATWSGPRPGGRLQFISQEEFRTSAPELFDRVRPTVPGEVEIWDLRWDQISGYAWADKGVKLRAVRYDDEQGRTQGLALYKVEGGADMTKHSLEVRSFVAATADAYAALWRYLLEVDLVSEVTADLRSVDEPLRWMVGDMRAIRMSPRDHQHLRILDVPAALQARSYSTPGRIGLVVTDDLGFAAGRYLLEIDADGAAGVRPLPGSATLDGAAVALTVNELSAIYLGGVSAGTLAAAGRMTELRPGSAAAVDAAFRWHRTPSLSISY